MTPDTQRSSAHSIPETIRYLSPRNLPGVEVLWVDNCARLWRVFHQTYTICCAREGSGVCEWIYRGRNCRTFERELQLMEPGEVHCNTRISAPGSFQVLFVSPAVMAGLCGEVDGTGHPHFKAATSADRRLYEAFGRFHGCVAADESVLEQQTRLVGCIALLLGLCAEREWRLASAGARHALRRARDFLHEHFNESVALLTLARIAGLSQFHFVRAFAHEFGLPPHAYQIALRASHVRSLLKFGVPVSEIDAGFADQSHLIRHFKRVYGVTPAHYGSMLGIRAPRQPRSK